MHYRAIRDKFLKMEENSNSIATTTTRRSNEIQNEDMQSDAEGHNVDTGNYVSEIDQCKVSDLERIPHSEESVSALEEADQQDDLKMKNQKVMKRGWKSNMIMA